MKIKDIARLIDVPVDRIKILSQSEIEEYAHNTVLYKNEHSWAGDEGNIAYIIDGDKLYRLPCGGWYSDNGCVVDDDPPIPLVVALHRGGAKEGDVVAVVSWKSFDRDFWPAEAVAFRVSSAMLEAGKASDMAEVEV